MHGDDAITTLIGSPIPCIGFQWINRMFHHVLREARNKDRHGNLLPGKLILDLLLEFRSWVIDTNMVASVAALYLR